MPLGFITNGGDVTRGVVAQTQVGNLCACVVSFPTRIDDENNYVLDSTFDTVKRYQQERLQRSD